MEYVVLVFCGLVVFEFIRLWIIPLIVLSCRYGLAAGLFLTIAYGKDPFKEMKRKTWVIVHVADH